MQMSFDPAASPEQLLESIHAYVNVAEELLKTDQIELLEGLDSAVDALCAAIQKMSPEESLRYKDPLEELYGCIDALGKQMQAAQKDIAATIASLSTNKKAAVAYRKQTSENS